MFRSTYFVGLYLFSNMLFVDLAVLIIIFVALFLHSFHFIIVVCLHFEIKISQHVSRPFLSFSISHMTVFCMFQTQQHWWQNTISPRNEKGTTKAIETEKLAKKIKNKCSMIAVCSRHCNIHNKARFFVWNFYVISNWDFDIVLIA